MPSQIRGAHTFACCFALTPRAVPLTLDLMVHRTIHDWTRPASSSVLAVRTASPTRDDPMNISKIAAVAALALAGGLAHAGPTNIGDADGIGTFDFSGTKDSAFYVVLGP